MYLEGKGDCMKLYFSVLGGMDSPKMEINNNQIL